MAPPSFVSTFTPAPPPRSRSLAWRIAALAACMAVLLPAGGWVLYRQACRTAELRAQEALQVNVRLHARALNEWLAERRADASVVAGNPLLADALRRLLLQGGEATAIQAHVDELRRRYGYRAIAIVDAARGRVLAGSGNVPDVQALGDLSHIDSGRPVWRELQPEPGRFYRGVMLQGIALRGMASAPILVLEPDARRLVTALHQEVQRDQAGTSVLLHDRPTGLWMLEVADPPQPPAIIATTGGQLSARAVGAAVVAEEPLDLDGWRLGGLLDDAAVYGPVRRQALQALAVLALLAAGGGAAVLAWRQVERLRHAARETGMRRYYEEALRGSADIFILFDEAGRVVDASATALAALGYDRAAALRLSMAQLVPGSAYACLLELMAGMAPEESRRFRSECLRADGSRFVQEGSLGRVQIDGRCYYHSIGRDVTRMQEVQARLRTATSFFERSMAAIVVSDGQGRIRSANPAFTRITGHAPEQVAGLEVRLLNGEPASETTQRMRAQLATLGHWEGELTGRRHDGELYPRRLSVSVHRDAAGQIEQYISIFTDLTRLRKAETRATYLAHHDRLTGLPNRARLEARLPGLIAQAAARGASLTLALFNVDRFQSINESLGHTQGDALLVALAQRLREAVPADDHLFRYGGDEFMVVMPGHPVTHALALDQLHAALARPVALERHTLAVTASAGVASTPQHASDADMLLRNVGAAMRMAKAQGCNSWRLYAPEMNASAYDDMLLVVELRHAMERGELALYTQPQFRLVDGALVGMEALLRWQHAGRGMVPPGRFIPLAEAAGLMDELGTWVLREACRTWAGWRAAGLNPPPVAVNVSAPQFRHPDFPAQVAAVLREYELPPEALEMELTESLVMDDTEQSIATMRALVDMGIRLAIDDFGTGHSSLSYLRRFPVAKLKIDRSFVLDLGPDGGEAGPAIAKAVIAMARSLNLKVLAEGVETAAQRDFLREHGCDEVQGYLYAKPLPAADMAALLEPEAVAAR